MNLVDDYLMVTNLIPKELCKSLILESSHLKWEKHSWYDYKKDNIISSQTKEAETVLSTAKQFEQITKYLVEALINYQKKYSIKGDKTEGKWINKITPIKFVRYAVGTHMHQHYDHIQSIFDGQLKGIPIISIVGLLNDNYKGGEFMCRGKKIKLTQGDILLFPSNFMFPHEVKEITQGIRHSFVSWGF
tara:strand:+ start:1806 stop:2372 length:567 start_codon:yes stop_codon:yes gene_type:complete